jgi:hypothetical protein
VRLAISGSEFVIGIGARAALAALVAALLGVVMGLVRAGCAGKRPLPQEIDAAPADFAMEAVIIAPSASDWRERPRDFRPARYILRADGRLHAQIGPRSHERYPPFVTRLEPREIERLWRIVRDSGLLEEGNPIRVSASDEFTIPGRTNAEVSVSFLDEHWHFRTTLESGTPESAAVRRIVDRLAQEAFVEP